jgi:hypothetical protein
MFIYSYTLTRKAHCMNVYSIIERWVGIFFLFVALAYGLKRSVAAHNLSKEFNICLLVSYTQLHKQTTLYISATK